MQIARINAVGIEQISAALGRHHKLGREHFTPGMIQAWASAAEDRFAEGNGCVFEIKSWDSTSGAAVEIEITATGYDIESVEEEQE